nr:phage recombination protein Bet [Clavibacter sp. VKM Ac-2872]
MVLAPRPVVEAFLLHCRRTGLDPIARQIYCIERGGKWGTQVSIDGARLVAERTKEYRGQTPTQWTADGVTWVDVWLPKDPPAAARVGVLREGFSQPLVAVATWDQYADKNGAMWKKMGALMLGKCAEMLALRKAFPQDLSGLYSTEEMDQAGGPKSAAVVEQPTPELVQVQEQPAAAVDWEALASKATSRDELNAIWQRVGREDPRARTQQLQIRMKEFASSMTSRPTPEPEKPWAKETPQEEVVEATVVDEEQPPAGGWPTAQVPLVEDEPDPEPYGGGDRA